MSEYWIWYLRFQNMLIKYIRPEVIITIADNTLVSSPFGGDQFFHNVKGARRVRIKGATYISQIRLIKH